jgi:hypothetical protein
MQGLAEPGFDYRWFAGIAILQARNMPVLWSNVHKNVVIQSK